MPIYQYKCKDCDYEFEKLLKMDNRKEPVEEPCHKCGGQVGQVLTKVGFTDSYRLGRIKPDANTREMLNRIDKANPNNTMELNW